ncbi:hypothetical protein GCM10022250_05990 [Flavobacterium chungbukense]|uniref:Uncharacterized protein n=2 Tax=Flavobacterium chungbukense TaxID=877464 RepID=A0ABP7XNQ3_9FLAO|nr:hypothetical protein [Flavobacterium chungbukense]
MKVSLNNEFGVIIKDEADKPNFCGVIRWDTLKENDTEDWRGQFGTFISIGGKVLDSGYVFKFITEKGLPK